MTIKLLGKSHLFIHSTVECKKIWNTKRISEFSVSSADIAVPVNHWEPLGSRRWWRRWLMTLLRLMTEHPWMYRDGGDGMGMEGFISISMQRWSHFLRGPSATEAHSKGVSPCRRTDENTRPCKPSTNRPPWDKPLTNDMSHNLHGEYELLPSGRRCRVPCCRLNRVIYPCVYQA